MSRERENCLIQRDCPSAIYTRVSTTTGLRPEVQLAGCPYEASSAFIKSQAHAGWVQVKTRYDDDDISGADRSWRTPGLRKVDVSVVCKGRRPSCRRHASSLQHTTRNRRGNSSWGFQSNRGALQRRFEARRPAWTDYSSQHGTKNQCLELGTKRLANALGASMNSNSGLGRLR